MADPRTQTQPTIGELLGELTRETGTLIRQQMELARLELSQRLSRLGRGLTRVVIGGALATAGLLAIVAGIVLAVTALGVPAWVSALVVGAALALVGWLIAQQAMSAMNREELTPRATIENQGERGMDQDPHQDLGASPRPAQQPRGADTDQAEMKVETLRGDMEDTRAQIAGTMEQLEERLAPGNLASDAATAVKDAASRRMEQVMHTASERMSEMTERTRGAAGALAERAGSNPWPAVLIGAGLGYLLYHALSEDESRWDGGWNARGSSRGYPEGHAVAYTPESGTYDSAGSHAVEGQTVRDLAHRGGRQLARAGRRASTVASRGARMVRDNPIGFGIAALAAGAAVGLSAPETETENEWMGDTRDKLMERAKEMAGVESGTTSAAEPQPGPTGRS